MFVTRVMSRTAMASAAAGAFWLEYGFETKLFLYACVLDVGLTMFSLVLDDLVRLLDEPKGRR
jgi:hypothetical protein